MKCAAQVSTGYYLPPKRQCRRSATTPVGDLVFCLVHARKARKKLEKPFDMKAALGITCGCEALRPCDAHRMKERAAE